MFTGIVTDIGTVRALEKSSGGDLRVGIQTALDLSSVKIGDSIACDGCCLTVVGLEDKLFQVDISHETFDITTLNHWKNGAQINLEKALCAGDALGGHIVSGHVDGLAEVLAIAPENGSHRLNFSAPAELMAMIAPKGSVTLNGVSLTVNEVGAQEFGVNIIPHTWAQTNLGQLNVGDKVNLEIDVLARYVARMMNVKDAL